MEVLGLKVEGKYVRKQGIQSSSNIGDCLWSDVGWDLQRGLLEGSELFRG
jgi:hypothetical protein